MMEKIFGYVKALAVLAAVVMSAVDSVAMSEARCDTVPMPPVSRDALPAYHPTDSNAVSLTIDIDGFRANLDGVKIVKDVEYVDRDGVKLNLIVISPENPVNAPCMLYVQGSAWREQAFYPPNMGEYARRGYVVAIVQYRHSGIAPFPAQVQDCKTAIRYMRKNAEHFGINPDDIYLLGDSSGGHTALLAATTSGNMALDTDVYSEYSDTVKAVAAFFPPTDLYGMLLYPSTMDHNAGDSPEGMEIGGVEVSSHRDRAWWSSPIAYLTDHKIPPVLLAVGTLDELVPSNQSDRYALRLRELGHDYQFYTIEGASHGSDEFWTPQITQIVCDFFKAAH